VYRAHGKHAPSHKIISFALHVGSSQHLLSEVAMVNVRHGIHCPNIFILSFTLHVGTSHVFLSEDDMVNSSQRLHTLFESINSLS